MSASSSKCRHGIRRARLSARHPGCARRPVQDLQANRTQRSVRTRDSSDRRGHSRAALRAGQQTFRLGDIAEVRRGLEDRRRQDVYQGREAVLLGAISARSERYQVTPQSRTEGIEHHIEERLAIADQPKSSPSRSTNFSTFAEAIAIVLVCRSPPRLAGRLCRRPDDPDGARRHVLRHVADGIDLHRMPRRSRHCTRPTGRR